MMQTKNEEFFYFKQLSKLNAGLRPLTKLGIEGGGGLSMDNNREKLESIELTLKEN